MPYSDEIATWDLSPAINLLKTLSHPKQRSNLPIHSNPTRQSNDFEQPAVLSEARFESRHLGDFTDLWNYLSLPHSGTLDGEIRIEQSSLETEVGSLAKEVRWRDEVSGADLEDNVDAETIAGDGPKRTRKAAQRASRARKRVETSLLRQTNLRHVATESDTGNESGQELDRLRASPVRRAVIKDILRQPSEYARDFPSPPTSPSPPQERPSVTKKEACVSDPFHWVRNTIPAASSPCRILPTGNLSREARKSRLISRLTKQFPEDAKYLNNDGLIHPEFTPLNRTSNGIHVFVDISNITIGFHDCLKRSRNVPVATRIRRVPMSFHNFSLIIERGRPAAKRVLVGSDKHPHIEQARRIGYETNILERVHKTRQLTPRQIKYRNDDGLVGMSSGSESYPARQLEKWVEQAVDEVLHLKILESVIDAEKPSRIVLATGDAQEAEYSGGFLRMVERALLKGWMVEVVSFKFNTSGAYTRREFRCKWGPMFACVQLDSFVEDLVDDDDD